MGNGGWVFYKKNDLSPAIREVFPDGGRGFGRGARLRKNQPEPGISGEHFGFLFGPSLVRSVNAHEDGPWNLVIR